MKTVWGLIKIVLIVGVVLVGGFYLAIWIFMSIYFPWIDGLNSR